MKGIAKLAAMAVIAMGTLQVAASEASADYLVSVWQNDTNATVGGSYRWGNGSWKSFSLSPGRRFWTAWPLSQGSRSLNIRFDADPGPGRDHVGYRLRTYNHPTTIFDKGPTELFITRPNGRVDIVNTRN